MFEFLKDITIVGLYVFLLYNSSSYRFITSANKIKGAIVDVDDTLVKFLTFFEEFINNQFESKLVIKLLLPVAIRFYKMDIISNSEVTLKLVISIFALLDCKKPKVVLERYPDWYRKECLLAQEELIISRIKSIIAEGIVPIVKSNNGAGTEFFLSLRNTSHLDFLFVAISSRRKERKLQYSALSGIYDIIGFIGNNFADDIVTGILFNIKYVVYVGRSPFKSLFAKLGARLADVFEEAVKMLANS